MESQLLERKRSDWEVLVVDNLEEVLLEKTAAFLQGFLPEEADPVWSADLFKWKLGDRNPAGRGFLTCAVSEGKIVGAVSAAVKRLWVNQRLVLGAEVGDTYTHPDFQRLRPPQQNIFGRLATETRTRVMNRGIRILYGTPNANARPGWEKRLGYRCHPACDNRGFVRPTARGLAQRNPAFRRAFGFLFAGERAFEGATRAFWQIGRVFRGYTVEPMDKASEALDELWDRLKGQHPFSMVRDRAYFQHRFFGHPMARYRLFQISRRHRIEGVLATRRIKTPWGKECCCIADWFLDESKPLLFPILAARAIQEQDSSQIDRFFLWCGPRRRFRIPLRQLGFVRGPVSPIIFFQNAEGIEILEGCRDLSFTLACSDNI